jgi:asparagine synthase (glutamine-hydrolysing)
MCGIAGAVDLVGRRAFPQERILAMTRTLAHRGPDDQQIHREPGVALGVRRLAIIDVEHGRQPLANEDGTVWVAYEGELYDYTQLRKQLLDRGHTLATQCDTEAWVHLYEDEGEGAFNRVRGQFAVALWDRNRRTLLLGRDRAGIAPLFYTTVDGWLLWASEIKGLFASGMVTARPDLCGIDYFFNFFCLPNSRTCFANIQSLAPGQYLQVRGGRFQCRFYRDLDFPDAGQERRFARTEDAVEEFATLLRRAVRRRLVSERPVCSYLSGGIDSTAVLGLACQERGESVASFTIGLDRSGPHNEQPLAAETARLLGSCHTVVSMRSSDIVEAFPDVIRIAEGPVLDTTTACTLRLAQAVRQRGYVVSLTGEGADEALAGYGWFKWERLLRGLGGRLCLGLRWFLLSGLVGGGSRHRPPWAATAGIRTSQQFPYDMMAQSRETLYAPQMWQALDGHSAYDDLYVPVDRMVRWHPLNQALYLANKVMLSGLLLAAKGDRSMHNASTEGRYPFLDEEVVDFCASLDPRLKLRGLTEKWLLRQLIRQALPPGIVLRHKTMFRAHLGSSFLIPERPAWVDQLLSPESLKATGLFDLEGVRHAMEVQRSRPTFSLQRFVFDMGLAGVLSTQLWHHTYCGGGLADLPTWSPPAEDDVDMLHIHGRRIATQTVRHDLQHELDAPVWKPRSCLKPQENGNGSSQEPQVKEGGSSPEPQQNQHSTCIEPQRGGNRKVSQSSALGNGNTNKGESPNGAK